MYLKAKEPMIFEGTVIYFSRI